MAGQGVAAGLWAVALWALAALGGPAAALAQIAGAAPVAGAAVSGSVGDLAAGKARAPDGRLVIGLIPWEEPARAERAFAPVLRLLEKQLGRKLALRSAISAAELGKRLEGRAVDVGLLPPAAFVELKAAIPGLAYLATAALPPGASGGGLQPYSRSLIVVLAGSAPRSLKDLAGARFGMADPESPLAQALLFRLLAQRGVDAERYFGRLFQLKRHDRLLDALVAGSVQAAATHDAALDAAIARHGNAFRIIEDLGPVPGEAVVAAPHLDAADHAAIRAALLAVEPKRPEVVEARSSGWPLAGFVDLGEEFYDILRQPAAGRKR